MADPFQDVDSTGPEFIKTFADTMDVRQSDPTMEAIVAEYLGHLDVPPGGRGVSTAGQMLPWFEMTARQMEERDDVGTQLADAIVAELNLRAEAVTLYGYQAVATVIDRKGRN